MSDLLPFFEEQRVEVNTWPDRPRYLMSYAYKNDEQVALCAEYGVDLVVDSGAFTVSTKGKEVDHDAYLDWLVGHADHITFALSLDVIGDHHASRVNHELALERIGDTVHMVPAWHLGSPLEELDRMCRAYSLVCIGGAVPFAKTPHSLFTAVKQAHRIAAEHGTRLHGLGMTGNRIIHGLPWWSVDSSAWLSAVRFPVLPLANEHGRIEQIEHGSPLDGHSRTLVRQYGGDPDAIGTTGWSLIAHVGSDLGQRRRVWAMTACARAYMYVEAYKTAHQPAHPMRLYLSGDSGNPGGAVTPVIRAQELGSPWGRGPQTHDLWDKPLTLLDGTSVA